MAALTHSRIVAILQSVDIFGETPADILTEVASIVEEVQCANGDTIVERGSTGTCMYIIVSGRVQVHDGDRILDYLGSRQVFGEMALLDASPRAASVSALEPSHLLRLDRGPFYRLLASQPEVARGITHVLSRHLRARIQDIAESFQYQLQLERQIQDQLRAIAQAHVETIFALTKLAESRDADTGAHLENIRNYSRTLAEQLRLDSAYADTVDSRYLELLYMASPLHDIGKVGVPDRILLKPGKFTPEERAIMQTHARIGADTLRAVEARFAGNEFVHMGIDIAHWHHERWDGRGYPDRLAGELIPLSARIVAVADVYDALTSRRVYKEAFDHAASRDIILSESGQHFDPVLVRAFMAAEDKLQAVRKYTAEPPPA